MRACAVQLGEKKSVAYNLLFHLTVVAAGNKSFFVCFPFAENVFAIVQWQLWNDWYLRCSTDIGRFPSRNYKLRQHCTPFSAVGLQFLVIISNHSGSCNNVPVFTPVTPNDGECSEVQIGSVYRTVIEVTLADLSKQWEILYFILKNGNPWWRKNVSKFYINNLLISNGLWSKEMAIPDADVPLCPNPSRYKWK